MYFRVLGIFGFLEILFSVLFQANVLPDNLFSIFAQLPLVAVIVWLWLQTDKRQREDNEKFRQWLEHMMEIQRQTNQDGNMFLNTLLAQIEAKQNRTSDIIELLTQQVAINTSTVNEIAKVDSIVAELIDRLERK